MNGRRFLAAALVGGVVAVLPGTVSALAAGAQTIAVVIDFGNGQSPEIVCASTSNGASDAQALTNAMTQMGQAAPTFASTGLLCSIAGYPTSGCGSSAASHYAYWAYFHGTSSGWSYAHNGPAEQAATAPVAEGWRFESNGTGGSSDPAPASSSNAATLCPVTPVSTTTPSTTVPQGSAQGAAVTTTTTKAAASTSGSTLSTKQGVSVAPQATGANEAMHSASHNSPLLAVLLVCGAAVGVVGGALLWRRVHG